LFEEEGAAGLTHQRVAHRAGVGRATVYRHWPTPVDLVSEALSTAEQPLLRFGEGPLRDWLRRELTRAAGELATPAALQFIATVVGTADQTPAVASLRDDLLRRTAVVLCRVLDRAVVNGELRARPDPDMLVAALLGPLIFRVTIQKVSVDEAYLERLLDAALGPPE
jgi:AcrR family transcriptional regulator